MKRPLLYSTLLLALSASPLSAAAGTTTPPEKIDTVTVTEAQLDANLPIRTPFLLDSLNLAGKAYDPVEILDNNETLVLRKSPKGSTQIQKGAALPENTLSLIRFTIDTDRFAKVKLNSPKIENFYVYLNGNRSTTSELRLQPGRSQISLLCYSNKEAKDSFEISITGKGVQHLRINEKGARLYDLNDMTLGEHFYRMKISPSGRYAVTYYYNITSNGESEYRTVLTDLNNKKTLINQSGYESLTWLPKRDLFYFTRKTNGSRNLLCLDPATMQETVIGQSIPEGDFQISPNEKFLIFNVTDSGPEANGAFKQILHPDDRFSGWRERNSLFYYDIASGEQQRLTYGNESISLEDISEDGTRLLLSRHKFEPNTLPFDRTDLFEMNTQSWKVDTVLTNQPWINGMQYSPKGDQILVLGTPAAFDAVGSEVKSSQQPQGFDIRLFLYDLRSKKVTPLLKNFAPSVEHAEWHSADGMIYMKCTDGYDQSIWRLNPYNKDRFRFELPITSVDNFSIANSKNPRMVCFGQTATTARNGYLVQLNGATPQAQAFGEISFAKLYPEVSVPTSKTWSFTSSKGDEVKGYYFLPATFDASRKYPMIVYYYGGVSPTTRELEFAYPLSVLANMGYVVLTLNPSGTVGFGQEWAARHSNAWGEGTADEIIEGTKTFCRQFSYVDASKVGCVGASYGGFMTQYLQTKTDIFAAAISHAGISNIASYWGGGRWGYSYSEAAAYGSFPWNNPQLYTQHSPLFNADKIHTPLLLLHGTMDTNVPTTESQQLYTALRILGREVSYITVEGEDHYISDFKKRRKWQETIMAWFAKYLQGDDTWWKEMGYK